LLARRALLAGDAVQRGWNLLNGVFETGVRAGPSFLENPSQLADNSSTKIKKWN
jgi:hypothetical protein